MIKINGNCIDIGKFPDGSMLVKYDPSKHFTSGFVKLSWYYENDREFLALMYLVKHFRAHGINNIYLYSTVSEALINNLYIYSPQSYIHRAINDVAKNLVNKRSLALFYPDSGSAKRYAHLTTNLPYAFGVKNRNWETGAIEGLSVIADEDKCPIAGMDILIVDDICSRGGTFYHSAKKLKELGANDIYLYVSHCENTILEGELLDGDLIKKVYTTDSIFTKTHEKIEVLK